MADPAPRCIKLVGYFQYYPFCPDDLKKMWTPMLKVFQHVTERLQSATVESTKIPVTPGRESSTIRSPSAEDGSLTIYLRCVPEHYLFNSRHFYRKLLEQIKYDTLVLFLAPECPDLSVMYANLNDKVRSPWQKGKYKGVEGIESVLRMLVEEYHAQW
jgi:hypothetical protein